MTPCNGFIISIFLLALIIPFSTQAQQQNCSKADITVEVTDARDGKGGTVKVLATNSNFKFELHLFGTGANAGKYERVKITTGEIENVPAGTYDLIVHSRSKDYCSETRTVTVN
jgi:hypothetical protein